MDDTDASTSDSSSDESTPAQTVSGHSEAQAPSSNGAPVLENDDSDSDISMSADSDDDEDEAPNTSSIQVNQDMINLEGPANTPSAGPAGDKLNKRKYSSTAEDVSNGLPQDTRKRLKPVEELHISRTLDGALPRDKSLLPAEIWHHIFTFIPPRNLCLMLSVNRSFNAFLDPSSSGPSISPLSKSVLSMMKPDAIWRASRRLFLPGMPSPLSGKSELDMLKLARSSSCQFCGKKKQPNPTLPVDLWHPGPGENGVIPIWSFGVMSCGPCIQRRCMKEIDLLLSSSVPSPLMAALPFVFLTNELHVLPLATLQNGQPPPQIQITKNFFQPHIDDMKREFLDVQTMGSATAEEWLKGLDDRGKERRNDSMRWERWEASGGIARIHIAEPQGASRSTTQPGNVTVLVSTPGSAQGPALNGNMPIFAEINLSAPQVSQLPPPPIHTSLPPNPQRFDSPSQNGLTPLPPRTYPQLRHERTKEEVADLKAARRAEIERRCMLLDPPLTAGVLAHMPSFQAAIQIIQPLDDGAWQVLEPRLISQRQDAEQRENERLAQTRVVQERSEERNYQDVQPRPELKDIDREWEDIQAPLRLRIGGYADETIRDAWAGGNKVTKDNCPSFAAEVLMYVRKRFYAEVAKDEAAIRAAGHEPEMDPPGGPYTRKLTLENMKWVFDTKIKPHTEQYRKELFLCSECDNHFKFYGFEGVIQHYAAKHTNDLSVGSVVVHWKSEWPEYPPFNPEPLTSKPSYYAAPPSAVVPYPVTLPQQSYGYGGYQPSPLSASMPPANPHGYQENPSTFYGQPQFGDHYTGHQNDPYTPAYAEGPQGYPAPQYSGPPPVGNNLGYNEPPQDYSQPGFGGQYPATTQGYYGPPHPGPLYPASAPEVVAQQQPYAPPGSQYGYSYPQPAIQVPATPANQFTPAPLPEKTEAYKTQLQDVAKSARDVWDAINNIKDVPWSVKVYAILFHVLKSSRANFPEDPPLTMIIDGLSNNKNMRKVRNINGLLCRACSLGMVGSSSNSQKKHFSFPQLVNHFHTAHEQGISQNESGYIPDWTKDMVELPELTRLAPILEKPGANEQKVKLIGEALPEIFAKPEQSFSENHPVQTNTYEGRDQYALAPSQDNHERYYTTVDSSRPSESGSGPYDNGQYDPRNPRDPREDRVPEDGHQRYNILRRAKEYYPAYEARRMSPSSHVRSAKAFEHGIPREDASSFVSRPIRYLDEGIVEYRVRREPASLSYEDPPVRRVDRQDIPTSIAPEDATRSSHYLPAEDAVAQQNRVFEVVAQITQQAKEARERKPVKREPGLGPEEGEQQARPSSKADEKVRLPPSVEASSAAERFLNEFQPGEVTGIAKMGDLDRVKEDRLARSDDRVDSVQHAYQHLAEPRRARDGYEEDGRVIMSRGRPVVEDEAGYIIRERVPHARQSPAYAYDDRFVHSSPDQARDRSPELVDRRYKLNNVIYREERPSGHGMRRTPSQFARYESVRLENDRGRSRSPVYVKVGAQPGQYRERSPAHPFQEAVYGPRAPLPENIAYERAPRQEYYRVYADDPRPRQPHYVETYEYVQVSDPKGDYMIRRPVRREREPEPVHVTYEDEQYARKPVYEDEQYARKPVYETRPQVSRSDPAYYEEYDPRHPAPPPSAPPARQRYQ